MALGVGLATAYLGYKASQDAADKGADAMGDASKRSAASQAKMIEQYEKAVADLEAIGIPSIEAQKISLEYAQLGPSALEQVSTDPMLAAEQYDSLKQLGELSGPGLTPEDRAEQFMISQSSSREAKARGNSIKQNMAQRGLSGSGIDLATQLSSSQGAADRGAMQQAQMISDRAKARRSAIESKANLAGKMEANQYGRDANVASAKDRIEQFNKTQRAGAKNQQEMANKALIQQDFQNRMSKGQAKANARAGVAGGYQAGAENAMKEGMAKSKGYADQGAAQSQLYGDLGTAGIKYFSDTAEDGGIMGYEDGGMVNPYLSVPNSNAGYEDGGLTEGGIMSDEMMDDEMMEGQPDYRAGEVVPGESYAGDRVDAKVNSGEMVLNIEQQQRLMDLLKGYKSLQELGNENIVDPAGGMPEEEMGAEMMPPMEQAPEAPMPMIPEGQEVPLENGGMVPAEYDGDKYEHGGHYKPRGIHSTLESEKKQLERKDGEQKARKARIKALEILKNGGR